jgi:hypothetical protein
MAAGSVSTQAEMMLLTVLHCRPERFAAMVPATPLESTCVVDTGRPYSSAIRDGRGRDDFRGCSASDETINLRGLWPKAAEAQLFTEGMSARQANADK